MNTASTEYFEAMRAALAYLRHACHYECLHNDDEALRRERSSTAEVILSARLERQLRSLNPGLSENGLRRARNALQQPAQQSLALAQQQLHARLTQSAPVRYFDFENAANNHFLAVEQFRMTSAAASHTVDLAVFVNGIPLALAAIGATNSKEGLQAGLRRLTQLKAHDAVPRLFHTTQIQLVVQKNFSAAASANAEAEDFQPWDDPYPLTWEEVRAALRQIPAHESDLPTALDLALAGLLTPRALLDLMQNFLRFEPGHRGLKTRLAWCHQYQAVRQTCARLANTAAPMRSGVLWHPGASGKTHTLAWLAGQLRLMPTFHAHALVILTDCERQRELLRRVFQQHRLDLPDEITEAAALMQILRRASGATLLLAPKIFREVCFGAAPQAMSETPLLILIDEPHATEDEALFDDLTRTFPNAHVIGCSAYPPRRDAQEPILHSFSFAQAQRRGYLLPAKLEARLPRLHQQIENGGDVPSGFAVETARRASTLPAQVAARRITSLVEDVHAHFHQEIRSNACKGLVLAADSESAALYFHALEKAMPEQVAVLLPKPQPQERELAALFRRFDDVAELVRRWRDPHDELALLILAGPLTSELRAPVLQALYVDRPLQGYELLQAIAFTQMPDAEHKHFGLLVDYYGVTQNLTRELAQFDYLQPEEIITPRFAEEAFEEMRLRRRELHAIFKSYPEQDDLDSWLFTLEPAEPRRAFQKIWQAFVKVLDQLLPALQEEIKFLQEALWFDRVRREAAAFYFDQALAGAQGSRKVRQALETFAREHGVMHVRELSSLGAENFLQDIDALGSLQAKVLRLQYALVEEIRRNLKRDPVFYQALQQRVTKITVERQQQKIDEETALQRLREEVLRLRAEALTAEPASSLAPDAQAYWRVLARYLAPREAEYGRYEDLAARLVATLEPDTHIIDWTMKEDWQREMRRKIKHLLREANCPQDLLDPLTQALMQLTKARFG
ncbi:DUF3387 domain-containing protein [candidate division KSB1 bacterium]|nr:DUF3387 domain-containing protein [candidate division KSB1 bacterium]